MNDKSKKETKLSLASPHDNSDETSGSAAAENGAENGRVMVTAAGGSREASIVLPPAQTEHSFAIEGFVPEEPPAGDMSHIPVVEGVKEENPEKERKIFLLFCFTCVGALALVIGLSIGLREKETIVAESTTAAPTPVVLPPTDAPTMFPTSEDYIAVLEQLSFEFPDWTIEGDSQLAALWMAEDNLYPVPIAANDTLSRLQFRQRFAMSTFYYATNGDEWYDDCNFLSPEHICNWTCPLSQNAATLDPRERLVFYGLLVFTTSGAVDDMGVACVDEIFAVGIEIVENGLTGTIPKELEALNFPGVIDPFFTLALYPGAATQMTGTIPWESFQPSDPQSLGLISLFLPNNKLTGSLPANLPEIMPNLNSISLDFNELSGPLPPALSSMALLGALYLSGNQLSGSLDETGIFDMPSCQLIDLSFNQLTGTIPEIRLDPNNTFPLTNIAMEENLLSGRIPESIGNFGALVNLDFYANLLSGSIPEIIGDLLALDNLLLGENALTGSLPFTIKTMTSLSGLVVEANQLTGRPFEEELFHDLPNLRTLRLSLNNFTGPFNINAERWAPTMGRLGVWRNQFTGTIPTEIGLLINLSFLELGINDFSGTVPTEIAQLTGLTGLWANGLNITGSFNGFCDAVEADPSQGWITDCLEDVVECSCCTECCDKSLVGGSVEWEDGERYVDYCRVV